MINEKDVETIRSEARQVNLPLPIRWQNSLAGTDKTLEELKDSNHIPYLTAKKISKLD